MAEQAARAQRRTRVLVLGGGIAGMAAAHRLAGQGLEVLLLEASDQLGGLGTFVQSGRDDVERFYHCVMPTDESLLALLEAIGVRETIEWRRTTMGIVVEGRHFPFNTALDLLRFSPLSLVQRIRLGVVSLMLHRLGRGKDLDHVRTEDWLRGLYGDQIWEKVWEPLFRSKFGAAVGDVPALYLWQRLGREKNVAVRGYPRGGYKALIDALRASIVAHGGVVRTSAPVDRLHADAQHATVRLVSGEVLSADWVVSTLPIPLLRVIAADDADLSALLPTLDLPYQGVVNALFFLRRPLEGHYWTPVLSSGTDFDGVVEMSSLTGPERYSGRHLAYTMKYTDRSSALYAEDETSIADRWTDQLLALYADLQLTRADVLEVQVHKAPFVEPSYPLGYAKAKPDIAVGDSRLLLDTTAQIYPRVTAWNSSAGLSDQVVAHLATRMAETSTPGADAGDHDARTAR